MWVACRCIRTAGSPSLPGPSTRRSTSPSLPCGSWRPDPASLGVPAVVHRVGPRLPRRQHRPPFGSQLLHVLRMRAEPEDPFIQPGLERRGVPGHGVPVPIEPVVPVVIALRVAWVAGLRFYYDGVH